MPSPQHLHNYLRANRKRLGLTQDEVAYLLGIQSGAKISRYEHFERSPRLETAFAFEAIFKRSASELFVGLYRKIEIEVAQREARLKARKRTLRVKSLKSNPHKQS